MENQNKKNILHENLQNEVYVIDNILIKIVFLPIFTA